MRHPRHCLANHPGFSSNITSTTHLVRHPFNLCQHTTHLTHNGTPFTPPTLGHNPHHPRSTKSQTLAHHQRHPAYPRYHATHTCIPPTLACHPRKQATTLARHQRKHATHTSLFCDFQSTKSFEELNSLLLKFFCYVTWFDERRLWKPCNKAYLSKFIVSLKQQLTLTNAFLMVLEPFIQESVLIWKKNNQFLKKLSLDQTLPFKTQLYLLQRVVTIFGLPML